MEKKKICVVSATRAEYGILKPLIIKLKKSSEWETQLVLTGAHLVEKFGNTYQEVEEDGIEIFRKISINTEGNTDYDISLIMANALVGFGRYFQEEKPDLLIVLGDRTEILAICAAAVNAHVPIAHLHGGELTQGAVDDSMRHAITKMSYLHFASTEEYRRRIIQMGEEPERVFNVGSLGVENVLREELLDREALGKEIDFPTEKDYVIVTFHPVTLEPGTAHRQVKELFLAMQSRKDLFYLITKANADAGGAVINAYMEQEVKKHPNMRLVSSLGMKRYLSAVKYARFVLGNSSSGIIEVPSLGIPTVNVGDRQKGRIMAKSIISCEPKCQSVLDAIEQAMKMKCEKYESPYGTGNTSKQIIQIIKSYLEMKQVDLKKRFYDIS
ncbi:MAG: UDP-N-acetylglucosamine 2-epimerase (hydrolyzing) [Lachnospiraceae bacterium]|nr:UDP-N-acetylglucosamine 2-epimerase (hydrolyzing) [Lachnospiraceae bacterium]